MKLFATLLKKIFSLLPSVWDNPISIFGAGLTTTSAFIIITVIILEWTGFHSNPYVGIIVYLVMPTLFGLGLAMVPVGNWIWRRRRARFGEGRPFIIQMNLNDPAFQRRSLAIAVLSLVNVVIITAASYQAVTFMDSNEFCGQVCHTVMNPEYTSYQNSPHSRVHCVDCHIGSGADWFVKYKLSGIGQVWAVAINSYPRPIPTPVEDLRPARETCEQCHWPEKFHEDRIRVVRKYGEDEANTTNYTVLLMKVGGSNSYTGKSTGIHWHVGRENVVEYFATDRQRQTIPWVRLLSPDGKATEFISPDANLTPETINAQEKRIMDCVDCHNRPTHIYPLPERALDQAISDGLVDRSLPYIRKEGLALLTTRHEDKEVGKQHIADTLRQFYQENYPNVWEEKRPAIESSIEQIQGIYHKNVFPEMNVFWGTYSNNIGHSDFPGCFRCHDDEHQSADGKVISQDCETCHAILSFEEAQLPLLPNLITN